MALQASALNQHLTVLPDPVFTTRQASEAAGMSEATLRRMRSTGEGPPFVKLGRRVGYLRSGLQSWIVSRTVTSTSDARERGLSVV